MIVYSKNRGGAFQVGKVRVLVADEHTIVREGVCALLKPCDDMEIVGEAANGKETIEIVREQTPDVLVMNIAMPIIDGAEVTHRVRKQNSNIKVLLLTQYEDRDRILSGLKAGANGYIPKRATASDLVSAILTVYRGGCFLYPSVAKTVVDDYFQRIRHPGTLDSHDRLTHREREVLKLMAEGRKSREIAELFGIAIKTVIGHRTNIMRKLGIHNRTELIKYAIRRHLVSLEN
jgi:DNA-binding NarL/FixJ family response regulator